MALIDKDALIACLQKDPLYPLVERYGMSRVIDSQPTVDAVPSQLTKEEVKTIRIHMNAYKENLCNQHRWKEAEEYQQIIDKLDIMMDAERKI